MTFSLIACGQKTEEEIVVDDKIDKTVEELKIVAPVGAPSIAFYNYAENTNFETNGTPSNIVAMMSSEGGADVIVIDTVSGINAIKNGADYALAATITFGNFYIAATGNDEDGVMSKDDNIVLFGQNQTPDLVWHYIYGNEYDESISFVAAASDAASALQSGKDVEGNDVDYVFLAEPALFASLKKNEKATIYADVQKLYSEKANSRMIQASVFVKNNLNDETVNNFLASLKKDIVLLAKDNRVSINSKIFSAIEDFSFAFLCSIAFVILYLNKIHNSAITSIDPKIEAETINFPFK